VEAHSVAANAATATTDPRGITVSGDLFMGYLLLKPCQRGPGVRRRGQPVEDCQQDQVAHEGQDRDPVKAEKSRSHLLADDVAEENQDANDGHERGGLNPPAELPVIVQEVSRIGHPFGLPLGPRPAVAANHRDADGNQCNAHRE
jgi:hypothetical protein